jgi:16S rRNA (uracil1498-N3)-methyltransferase
MPWQPTSLPRLYVASDLGPGLTHACDASETNYLASVLRLDVGAEVLLFNGRDGEWLARMVEVSRRTCRLTAVERNRQQQAAQDIDYLFAPLKRARLDYMVQKATEMGVASLRPVLTRRTQAERVNLDRMKANAKEAAEQCGTLTVPSVLEPERLDRIISVWPAERRLIFCDEQAANADPVAALRLVPFGPLAVLIGPEGGFDPQEREALLSRPFVAAISLGPRILRADTAAIAVLTLVSAVLGDWRVAQ